MLSKNKRRIILALAAATLFFGFWAFAGSGNAGDRPEFDRSGVEVVRADGKRVAFKVEVASTKEQQTYGLMFVRALPEDEGMIFTFHPPRETAFWMKNTYIPLDIIFVRPNWTVARIAKMARPQDMTPIYSGEPIRAVLEVNGGLAQKYGLAAGDKVKFPASDE